VKAYDVALTFFRSPDNGHTSFSCPQKKVLQNCTWTREKGKIAIGSMIKIVELNISNKEFGGNKSFRRDYFTRDISKYSFELLAHLS
jgi:hypothetical protein